MKPVRLHVEGELGLGLFANALDYLQSAADHLAENSAQSLKYAILHLFAGVELLLKERLSREHWSLIFSDVSKATGLALKSGDFKSVDFDVCCQRLADIANVQIDDKRRAELNQLRNLRNRLQHFHTTVSISLSCMYSGA